MTTTLNHYGRKKGEYSFKPVDATPTTNPMFYYWELSGPDGAWFCLLPEEKHSIKDFKEALRYLKNEHDLTGWNWDYLQDATDRRNKALEEYEIWKKQQDAKGWKV